MLSTTQFQASLLVEEQIIPPPLPSQPSPTSHSVPSAIDIAQTPTLKSSLLRTRLSQPHPLTTAVTQSIYIVPSFTLECGVVLRDAPVAYKTWGTLNAARDNVLVICHALTGSADIEDWWGLMFGRRRAFDPAHFFIVCANVLGSPYGSASPLTINPDTGRPYGPEFPPTTIRDDVLIHKLVLDSLNINSLFAVIGGSMGGMHVLEWPLCTPKGYVRGIVPLATSVRHSAWGIAWGEVQRMCVMADPDFQGGYYEQGKEPKGGLAAARVCAMMTYRSRESFERRFARRRQGVKEEKKSVPKESVEKVGTGGPVRVLTPPPSPPQYASKELQDSTVAETLGTTPHTANVTTPTSTPIVTSTSPLTPVSTSSSTQTAAPSPLPIFQAQSYLRYQGNKFLARFDANCFIHITHKMDSHDIARGRDFPPVPLSSPSTMSCLSCHPQEQQEAQRPPSPASTTGSEDSLPCACEALAALPAHLDPIPDVIDPLTSAILATLPRTLVLGITSDVLFTPAEQAAIAKHIPGARLVMIESGEGHDGFLLEFQQMDGEIGAWLKEMGEEYYLGENNDDLEGGGDFEVKKTSVFGEAEVEGEFDG